MAGAVGERTALTPAGHPAVHQFRVALVAHLRSQAKTFHDPGTESLDEAVGLVYEAQHHLDRPRHLEVEGDGSPAAVEDVETIPAAGGALAIDADDLGSLVCEHHCAERARSDAGDLDDPETAQRSCHGSYPL